MTTARLSYAHAIRIFASTRAAFQIQGITQSDMMQIQQIMTQYADAEFDFADVSIMALAERLQITRIYTFDRRDFSIFRPTHCDYLELLP